MKELTKAFNGHDIRVIIKGGIEWFVARDVCDVLEIQDVSSALRDFPSQEADTHTMQVRSANGTEQKRSLAIINEPGLYRLIFKSRKPEAESFKTWVFSEVLPSIRKTGKYDTRDIRQKSVDYRNAFTAGCKRQGLKDPRDYGTVTKITYQNLFSDPNIRKAGMNRDQILALSALEAVEALKYNRLPEDTLKLPGIAQSIKSTTKLLKDAVREPARQIGVTA